MEFLDTFLTRRGMDLSPQGLSVVRVGLKLDIGQEAMVTGDVAVSDEEWSLSKAPGKIIRNGTMNPIDDKDQAVTITQVLNQTEIFDISLV